MIIAFPRSTRQWYDLLLSPPLMGFVSVIILSALLVLGLPVLQALRVG